MLQNFSVVKEMIMCRWGENNCAALFRNQSTPERQVLKPCRHLSQAFRTTEGLQAMECPSPCPPVSQEFLLPFPFA